MVTPDQQPMSLMLMLLSRQSQLQKALDRCLSIHGIGLSEFLVLHALKEAPDNTLNRITLAEAVHLTASGITRLLNPMEKMHLVEKEKSERDARMSLVKMTSAGAEVYDNAQQTFTETANKLLGDLSAKQKDTFMTLLVNLRWFSPHYVK